MEIECDNEKTIKEILDMLSLNNHEIVSVNTEELYRRKNINILEMDELKF
jgi:sulfur carrier protein ThiS